jgi:hypothetical protein
MLTTLSFLLFSFLQILAYAENTSQLALLEEHLKGGESLERIGQGKHKVVYRIKDTDLVIKSPNRFYLLTPLIQSECLSYEISQQLDFGVVPFIQYLFEGSEEELLIRERCPHLNGPFVLQRYIAPCDVPLDVEHAHKVILFNWITGRYDAKRENSIVDKRGKVWEIDNELGGAKLKRLIEEREDIYSAESHWLLEEAQIKVPISDQLLDWILDLPDEIELNKTLLPKLFREKIVLLREMRYHENLSLLKMALLILRSQEEPITFDLLKWIIQGFKTD